MRRSILLNFLEDYKKDGLNPFQLAYKPYGSLDPFHYAVHRDPKYENAYSLVWIACVPPNPHCGTAICKDNIPDEHDAENPCAKTEEDMQHIPSEHLILIKLDEIPHAPPHWNDMTKFQERIILTIYVDKKELDDPQKQPQVDVTTEGLTKKHKV